MFRSLLPFSLLVSLLATSCGHHLNERLPSLAADKGGAAVSRDTAQSVELAIQKGNADELAAFLAAGFPVNALLNTGLTPLQQAIVSTSPAKFERVFRVLMEKGADPAIRDGAGNDALKLAEGKRVAARLLQADRNDELVKQLFEEIEAAEDRASIVGIFKDQGEDVNVVHPETGETPLTWAIGIRKRLIFGALMEESLREELDVNRPNREGKTPLRIATQTNWNLAIQPLVNRGAKEE